MNQLLLQVGELIKQKKDNEVFDITSLPNWNPQMDEELNQLIKTHQICGVLPHGFDGKVWEYVTASHSNHSVYIPEKVLVEKAEELIKKSTQYQDMKGYSHELQKYCEDLIQVAYQIIDEQVEFMRFNHLIIVSLLGKFRMDIAVASEENIDYVSLGGNPIIEKLFDLHNDCAKRLLAQ